jgi:dihydropteroate synthase
MGIVNVTPDSFASQGAHEAPQEALKALAKMTEAGADLIDLGGESTRPGHVPVSAADEWQRLEPVFTALGPDGLPPLSIDTWKAEVAARALGAGASIVNDVWGFQRDPAIAGVTADSGAAAILMHNRESVDPALDIVEDILSFLDQSLKIATSAGISEDRIVLDPGIGFGKTFAQSFQAVAALPRFKALGFPILLGLSRKGFIGSLSNPPIPPAGRLPGTIAANAAGALAGADILRVHDVAEHVQAARIIEGIRLAA